MRTEKNIINSDGTARFFFNKNSLGEKLTLKYIDYYHKPYLDIDLNLEGKNYSRVSWMIDFLKKNNIEILNVAGNAESHNPGTYNATFLFLSKVCEALGLQRKDN